MSVNPAATIYQRMCAILAELPAIGKDDWNPQQKFAFRGIDAVLNALNPLLAKHGVFYVPEILERLESERPTRSGGVLYVVNLHARFHFYGPDGDSVSATAWGEGTDSGDKATNKAMTGAMKYMLFTVFAISTAETSESDSDRHADPETVPRRNGAGPLADLEVVAALQGRIGALSDEAKAELRQEWKDAGISSLSHLLAADVEHAGALLARFEAQEVSGDGALVPGVGGENQAVPADADLVGRPFEEASA